MTAGADLISLLKLFPNVRAGVLGDLMADRFIYGSARRLSPEAPVPVVHIRERRTQPGGAANVGNNVLSLGGKLSLFGVFGDDDAGREALDSLLHDGAELSGVLLLAERQSTVKTRVVAQSQHLVRFDEEDTVPVSEGVAAQLYARIIMQIKDIDILAISDYAKGLLGANLIEQVLALCQERGIDVVVDPKPQNIKLFAGARVVKPNLVEALRLIGREQDRVDDEEIPEICHVVREQASVQDVIITAGSRGMYVLAGEKFTHLPAVPREVFDVAGAGDSTLAAITLALGAGASLVDAARLGNLAGSVAVSKLGVAAVKVEELQHELEGRDGTS